MSFLARYFRLDHCRGGFHHYKFSFEVEGAERGCRFDASEFVLVGAAYVSVVVGATETILLSTKGHSKEEGSQVSPIGGSVSPQSIGRDASQV
jgi:hypothetical protein